MAASLLLVRCLFGQINFEIEKYSAYRAELEQFKAAFEQVGRGDQGESIARAALEKARAAKDRPGEAHWLRWLGASFQRRGDFKGARPFYEQSLAIRRELDEKPDVLLLLVGIGSVCNDSRDFSAGLGYLGEATKLAVELKDSDKEFTAYRRLAEANTALANYPAALRAGFEALRVLNTPPNKNERNVAYVLDQIGTVFHDLDDSRKALDYYRQALETRLKSAPDDVIDSYSHIGVELDKLGSHDEAIQYFQKVMTERRKSKNSALIAGALVNLGNAQQGSGDLAGARASFSEALSVMGEKGATSRNAALALYGVGNIDIAEKKVDDALAHHRAAYKIRKESGDANGARRSLNRIAIALETGRRWNEALDVHREAMAEFENLLAGIADPVQALEFRRSSEILYPHYAKVLIELGRKEEALAIAERGRGIGFSRIASMNARRYSDLLGPSQKDELASATHRFAQARNRLRIAAEQGDETGRRDAEIDYREAERELTRVRDGLFASSKQIKAAQPAGHETRFTDFATYAQKHPETLFLEWLAVDQSVILFAISGPGGLSTYALPSSVGDIAHAAEHWSQAMRRGQRARGIRLEGSSSGVDEAALAREVYDGILGPAEKLIDDHKFARLAIIADGPLLQIPFPALIDGGGKRLTDSYSISTALSISSLLHPEAPASKRVKLYAVGDPTAVGQTRLLVPQMSRFDSLAGAREEAVAIVNLFSGSTAIIGAEAREAVVKRDLVGYDILHFATHGIFDKSDPLRSGLLLGPEPGTSGEDGVLEGWEIASLPLTSRLAVLSACETGQGRETLGDGLLGLSWAFQAAGCPNVVASLWSVDDAATRALMVEFYKSIRAGKRVDDAMRAAIAAIRLNKSYASPYYWSAFQVTGRAEAIFSRVGAHSRQ